MKPAVLGCAALTRHHVLGVETIPVLRGVDFSLAAGDTVAIVGASGSGKTTLVNILGGLDRPTSGTVQIGGQPLDGMPEKDLSVLRNRKLGFVFQFHHLLPEFTALENTVMPLLIRGEPRKQALQEATQLLQTVGLGERLQHKPAELSGGERQRVAIARALVGKPDCVLLDEPTGNLDQDMAKTIQDLLLALNRQLGTALLVVTHDPQFAARLNRRYRLDHGLLVAMA